MLDQIEAAMMQALDHGPGFLPDGLFAGLRPRVLAGMKVHANTINHARLVALEETYPRTRQWLGAAKFNDLSRQFIEQPGVCAHALTNIGQGFERFVAMQGEAAVANMARFEWLWLESFHAADARALAMADLAGIAVDALMALQLMAHPAARLTPIMAETARHLDMDNGASMECPAGANLLIIRPESLVSIILADEPMAALFVRAAQPVSIATLLTEPSESGEDQSSRADGLPTLMALIEAGALMEYKG